MTLFSDSFIYSTKGVYEKHDIGYLVDSLKKGGKYQFLTPIAWQRIRNNVDRTPYIIKKLA